MAAAKFALIYIIAMYKYISHLIAINENRRPLTCKILGNPKSVSALGLQDLNLAPYIKNI